MTTRFTNPANGDYYDWPIAWDTEEALERRRDITETANTANVGRVKQQGEDSPLVLQVSGTILERAHYEAMWHWTELCKSQTIYLRDFEGAEYEGQIIRFAPLRKRTVKNPRDNSIPLHYYTYQFSFEIYRIISGSLATAGVTP